MYATVDQFRDRHDRPENPELSQLTAVPGVTPVAPDLTRLGQVLSEASGEMDLYLGTRHSLPLVSLPAEQVADLERLCCDIARYRLWDERASDEVRQRYTDALAFLRETAAGRIRLGVADSGRQVATISSQTRRMTRDGLSGIL